MKRIKFQTLAKLGTCMLLILLLVKVFIGEWVYIPSDSMFPTKVQEVWFGTRKLHTGL